MTGSDFAREQYDAAQADASCKEARILADVKHWRCCACGRDCTVNLDRPLLGAFSDCCAKPAYNCDEITNASDSVSETGRLRTMRDIEGEAA